MLTNRCGECDNCKKLERVQRSVLRVVNPPFSHADDDTIKLWNRELAELPCLGKEELPNVDQETFRKSGRVD